MAAAGSWLHDLLPKRETVRRVTVGSEILTGIPERAATRRSRAARDDLRALAVLLLGPLTMLVGVIWAVAQPYRVVFLEREDKGVYDYLVQPPLLVFLVGAFYFLLIARGLVDDLEGEEGGSTT
jgi:hypothetical protein